MVSVAGIAGGGGVMKDGEALKRSGERVILVPGGARDMIHYRTQHNTFSSAYRTISTLYLAACTSSSVHRTPSA